jgi:hypothetical protein
MILDYKKHIFPSLNNQISVMQQNRLERFLSQSLLLEKIPAYVAMYMVKLNQIVFFSPSSSRTLGCQPTSCTSLLGSGQRLFGSSFGRGQNSMVDVVFVAFNLFRKL